MDIDYLQLFLVLLGGSGLAGWLLTYLQFREERQERVRLHFRELVMTKDFLALLGCLHSLLVIMNAVADLEKGSKPTMLVKDTQGQSSLVQIEHVDDLRPEFESWLRNLSVGHDTLMRSGVLFLLPDRINLQIIAALQCARDYGPHNAEPVRYQLRLLSVELKKILGLRILD
jgi:hypothetical protein